MLILSFNAHNLTQKSTTILCPAVPIATATHCCSIRYIPPAIPAAPFCYDSLPGALMGQQGMGYCGALYLMDQFHLNLQSNKLTFVCLYNNF